MIIKTTKQNPQHGAAGNDLGRARPQFWALFALVLLLLAGVSVADDRDLLRDAAGSPYMFVVMDTSGSMHWTPGCSEEDACLDIDPWDGMCTSECTLGATKCQQVCPNWGCVEYDFGGDPPRDIEIIMDTEDPSGVEINGVWNIGGIPPWKGDDYLHNNNSGQGSKSIEFTPEIPEAGSYMVYMFWSSNGSRATNVPIDVTHATGTTRVTVNQRQGHGEYNYIGTFDFDRGNTSSVLVGTAGTNGYVAVDAIRFYSLLKPDPPPACLREGYRCQQPLCPNGDCYAPLSADDPTSKFYQAKQAMYEVLSQAEDVHFGIGSYEQDNVRMMAKQWMYRVSEFKPTSEGFALDTDQDLWWDTTTVPFPAVGDGYVFGLGSPYDQFGGGDGWNCASYNNYPGKDGDPEGDAGHVGCFYSEPADWDSPWEFQRFRRIPKLGIFHNQDTTTWYRRGGTRYRVVFSPVSDLQADGTPYEYGDSEFAVDVELTNCGSSNCSGGTSVTRRIYFELVSDFAPWEGQLSRFPMRGNGFFDGQSVVSAGNTCNGLEPNDDRDANVTDGLAFSDDDTWWDYTFKQPTVEDSRGSTVTDLNGDPLPERVDWFDVGDFMPFDWTTTNKTPLLQRMAPNIIGGDLEPDFRMATYWADEYLLGSDPYSETNRRLRLKDDDEIPLLAYGSTPIGASLADFRRWYGGTDSESDLDGWAGVAASRDIDWACRQKYVLFLTDGNETCGGDPCDAARQLLKEGVRTFVVGFGLNDESSNLGCIALEGGTEEPILPRNKDELVEALEDILLQIRAESRAFASASIPAIQSSAADKIYLSSFIPLPGESFWPGEIDVFRKPLPLREGRPDTTRKCIDGDIARESGCHLYEVGELMVENQSPTALELLEDPPNLRIGEDRTDRRVFYGKENVTGKRPGDLVLFRPPYRGIDGDDFTDLEDLGLVLADEDTMTAYYNGLATADEVEAELLDVMIETLRPKSLGEAAEDDRTEYVLGDIFHANPLVVTSPTNFSYFSQDLCGLVQSLDVPNNCVEDEDRGYRDFALKHTWRRRVLAVAANDGQLHFYEAGVRSVEDFDPDPDDPTNEFEEVEVFTDGTGEELFSYMPRLTLPVLRDQANGDSHIFSIDGEMTLGDVFIDPAHLTGGVDTADREWRTVLIGGLREAGDVYEETDPVLDYVSGYYALDVTQPDILKQRESDRVVNTDGTLGVFNDPPQDSLLPVNDSLNVTPSELPSCMDFDYTESGHQVTQGAGAGTSGVFDCKYPYPAELWTFADTVENGRYYLDEEDNGDGTYGNGMRDLGATWSQPVIGQIAVCGVANGDCNPDLDGSDLETRHVAVFGGGMDPVYKFGPQQGTFFYMVDIETGQAIYKREVLGAVPTDPAVLDRDLDGIFDAIYFGTTDGLMYKIDLDGRDSNGDLPTVAQLNVRDRLLPYPGPGDPILVDRIDDDGGWDPFPLVETYDDAPIYFPPAAFFIPELNAYALSFGTGDREDLWLPSDKEGRFYVVVDDGITRDDYLASLPSLPCQERLPITDSCLESVAWNADPPTVDVDGVEVVDNSINFLEAPDPDDISALRPGWVMTFPQNQRITAAPFVISGILIYSIFQPVAFIPDTPVGDPPADPTDPAEEPVVCARTGTTRSFVVLARNANPVARLSGVDQGDDPDVDGTVIGGGSGGDTDGATDGHLKARDRYHKIGEFTTAPFVDRVASKNSPDDTGTTVNDLLETEIANQLEKVIMESYPRGSRFNNAFKLVVAALRNSTGVNVYAKIPIAIYPADWKEVTGTPRRNITTVEEPPIDPPPPVASPPATE